MAAKKKTKSTGAIGLSLLLHLAIIALLVVQAYLYVSAPQGNQDGESLDAVMVEPSQLDKQSSKTETHAKAQAEQAAELAKQRLEAEKQRQAELQRQQALEEQKKALEEQKKQAEQAAQQAKAAEEAKRQAELAAEKAKQEAEQKKQAEEARQQAEAKKAQEEAKKQAEAEKAKAEAEAKKAAAQKKQAEAKQQQALDDILGDLTAGKPKAASGVSNSELSRYTTEVKNAIRQKLINPQLYSGQVCILKINLSPDGTVRGVSAMQGEEMLCREAVSATRLANIPKPYSQALYEKVKNMELEFRL